MKKVTLFLCVVSLLFAFSCKQSEDVKSPKETVEIIKETLSLDDVTDPTFESVDLKPIRMSINADEGGALELIGGTEINIPANAFVDLDGKPIKGEVDIIVKEFKTLGDIILAGVNMKYDSAGVNHDFISAGMFHIDGEQKGKPIEIAEGKSIEYKMASDVDDLEDTPCYNFYEMDKEKNWQYVETKKAIKNPKYVEQDRFVEPKQVTSDDIVIELDMKGMKSFLNDDASVLWKYAGRRPDTIDKEMLNQITAKELDLRKTDEHQLSYEIRADINNSKFIIPVEPVLLGKDLEQARQNFNAKMEEIESSDETLRNYQQSQYMRVYSIPGFGMYNCDRINASPQNTLFVEVDKIHGVPQEFCKFYLVSKANNSTILYSGSTLSNFRYNPNSDNHIIAINPNSQVSVLHSTSFFKQLKEAQNDRIKLNFQEVDGVIKDGTDFLAIINEL